jgi:hypothetical protein
LFKELASHRNLLRVLSDAVKSVIQPPAEGGAVGCTTAFEKKTFEMEELLDEVELKASETRAELRAHLLEVQTVNFIHYCLLHWVLLETFPLLKFIRKF